MNIFDLIDASKISSDDKKIIQALVDYEVNFNHIITIMNHRRVNNSNIIDIIRELGFPESDIVAKALAKAYNLTYVSPTDVEYLHRDNFIQNKNILFFETLVKISSSESVPISYNEEKNELVIAVSDGSIAKSTIDNFKSIFSINLNRNKLVMPKFLVAIASKETVENVYLKVFSKTYEETMNTLENFTMGKSLPTADTMVATLIRHACYSGVSDIHFRPLSNSGLVGMRIDGKVSEFCALKKDDFERIIQTLKRNGRINSVIVDTKEASYDPPEGFKDLSERYAFRVQINNTVRGEAVVIRILDGRSNISSLDSIGFDDDVKERLLALTKQSSGLVVVAGPTGSGKTTTLNAILKKIDPIEKVVQTVENPVEYVFGAWQQHEISRVEDENRTEGEKWQKYFKGLLRNDIDVALLGEVRDKPTADAALELGNTGHLVFTTIHSNSASSVITRFDQMGIDMGIFGEVGRAVLAQRLVSKLCPYCKTKLEFDSEITQKTLSEIIKTITQSLPMLSDRNKKKWANRLGIPVENLSSIDKNLLFEKISLYKERKNGCDLCRYTGFKGRVGIYELLDINNKVKNKILKKETGHEITSEIALLDKMWGVGISHILSGETTLDEMASQVAREE